MFDYLVEQIHKSFSLMGDHRETKPDYELSDALMSGFAVFSLKDPSLLSFIDNYESRRTNLEQIYKIQSVPTDKGLKKILDPINPMRLLPTFKVLHEEEKVADLLTQRQCFESLGGYVPIAVDGTEYFCSNQVNCPHCLVRKLKNGEVQYYHQMVAACAVKPNDPIVLPVFAEPITRKDGATKNDCEYNAFKRLAPNLKQVLPDVAKLILLDGLFADGPAIKVLRRNQMDFITVIKEGYILVQVAKLEEQQALQSYTWTKHKHFQCTAKWTEDLILNGANQDIKVNYLQFQELDTRTDKITYQCQWISSIPIGKDIIPEFVSVARSKWKIENETFNVLKNHGYNLEHNYGHGKQFLSSLFAMLMFLAFLVDQLTQAIDITCQKAIKEAKTFRDFRQKVRVLFDFIPCLSMNIIYGIIARELKIGLSP